MKIVLTVCGLVFAGLLTMPAAARAEGMPGTPTVLVPTTSAHTSQIKPVIAGVTQSGTQVDVYIDNQFYGHATVVEGLQGTAHWSYVPFLNLSHGWHSIQVKAQNASGGRSLVSQPTYLFVDLLVPSPTLLKPVVNADTVASKPWIVGLTKGGMTLDIWIDGELNGSLEVQGEKEETVSFKYQPFLPLSSGTHTLQVTARDIYGAQSPASSLQFLVTAQTASRSQSQAQTAETSEQADSSTGTQETVTEESSAESPAAEKAQPAEPVEPTVQPTEETTTAPDVPAQEEVSTEVESPAEQSEGSTEDEGVQETTEAAESSEEKNSNVLSTVGWVLLALVAIGMITRGRGKKEEGTQLMKIDTSESTPHVEVIRKPESTQATTPDKISTPPTPPTTPTTPGV